MSKNGPERQEEVGRVDGTANALTVVLPVRHLRVWIIIGWLWVLRRRPLRTWAVGSLDRLRFVSAIRWSLLPPVKRPRLVLLKPTQDERWHLLFESNFDGDWDDYLEVFGAVIPGPLQSIIGLGHGFPGLQDMSMFKAYAKSFDHEPEHYVSAYPGLSSGDIYQELQAREGPGANRIARARGLGVHHPGWLTMVLPIAEGRRSEAVRAARALDDPGVAGRPLLLRTDRIHFGRVVILDRPSGSQLLISLTHDGTREDVAERLVAADREAAVGGSTPLRRLLECCRGVPNPFDGWWDDRRLVGHLLDAQPRSQRWQMAYCGYPGRSVRDIVALDSEPRRHERWPSPAPDFASGGF